MSITRPLWRLLLAASALGPARALAAPAVAVSDLDADYTGTSHGLVVLRLSAEAALTPSTYNVHLHYRVAGLIGLFTRTEDDSRTEGAFTASGVAPVRFSSTGFLRGNHRATEIVYTAGNPVIRTVEPPPEQERTPVPVAMTRGTVDTLSAIALLLHRLGAGGACNGLLTTFDGRRVSELTATDAGTVTLPRTGRIGYAGPAHRCDFVGRQTAGYKLTQPVAERGKPKQGSAWLAPIVPNAPPVPVRVEFDNDVLGHVTLTLDRVGGGSHGAQALGDRG